MLAAVNRHYGGPEVVRVEEIPTPIPMKGQVQVRVHASCVNSADHRLRSLSVPHGFGLIFRLVMGITAPRKHVLGVDATGVVTAVGPDVRSFRVGDRVAVSTGIEAGCHAEYLCIKESSLIVKVPEGLDLKFAAAILFGGTTALGFLRDKGKIAQNERVLIVGASGAVGVAAVQIAKHFGAHVTAVTSSANAELVKSIGADVSVDYLKKDYLKDLDAFDIVMDTVGTTSLDKVKDKLRERGRYLLVVADLKNMVLSGFRRLGAHRKVIASELGMSKELVATLLDFTARGVIRPVIDSEFPLAQIVDAHRRVDTGRKRGAVVVTVSEAAD